MKILLDTHALLWWAFAEQPIPARVSALIKNPATEVWVSSVSFWEIAIKLRLNKLAIPIQADEFLAQIRSRTRVQLLPMTAEHAVAAADLPPHHRDPFDRILVAQCLVERLHLASADERMRKYSVQVIWQ